MNNPKNESAAKSQTEEFDPRGPFAHWTEGIAADLERYNPGWKARVRAEWEAERKRREGTH